MQCGKGQVPSTPRRTLPHAQCRLAYHPTCAQLANFYMNIDPTASGGLQESYCEDHTIVRTLPVFFLKIPAWLSRSKKIRSWRGGCVAKQKYASLHVFLSLLTSKVQLGRFIDASTRKRISERVGEKIPKAAFEEILKYWKKKRHCLSWVISSLSYLDML